DRTFSQVQGIENIGDGSFVIKIGVSPDTDKGEYEKSFRQIYQPMLEAKEEQIKFLREEVNIKREELVCIRQEKNELLEIIKLRADQQININNYLNNQQGENNVNQQKPGNTYNQSGNFGIGHNEGEIKGNAKIGGVINKAAQQDLQQAATEIQQLLEQLSQDNPTETTAQKMVVGAQVVEVISNNPSRWKKPIKVIKAMGIEALAEAIDNPIFNVAKAGLEDALEE
ncbi:MAG: hypothetical protein AAF298_18620, partial [Cyanobacteria bacterium P01_A01_bin.40]